MALRRNFFIGVLNNATSLSNLFQTHAQAIVNGYHKDLVFLTKLVQRLYNFNALRAARDVFFSVRNPDLFLFRVLIKEFSANGFPLSSLSVYAHLRKNTDLRPDGFTYAYAILAVSEIGDSVFASILHAQLIVEGLSGDSAAGTAMVGLYCKLSKVGYARKVFDGIPHRDVPLGNTAVSGLARNGFSRQAVRVFLDMVGRGLRLNAGSLASVLPAAAEVKDLWLGAGIHCLCYKLGFDGNVNIATGLVSMYANCGDIGASRFLFDGICCPDLISCNAMIDGFSRNDDTESSVGLFKRLLGLRVRVNSGTVVGLIPVSSPYGHTQLVASIQSFSLKYGALSHPSVSTSLVSAYSRLSEIESARKLFDEIPEKKMESWNAMISGYTQNGLTEPAIFLFGKMMNEFTPNATTVVTILSACAQLGTLSLGTWVHKFVTEKKLDANTFVQTALVNMYAKCGDIEEARRIFDSIGDKNTATWNVMIAAYGLHGNGHEAFKLFNEMVGSRVSPDSITFLSVLSACSHAGLVRVGEEVFKSMVDDHGFKPSVVFYACMVDILGRAGHLDEAMEFIQKMDVKPDVAVWCSLLGACTIHKDQRVAKIASEKIFKIDPENSGYYITLSNVYTAKGNFLNATSVRRLLNVKRLRKTPGYTLIEIGDTTHLFKSGDKMHPRSADIYAMLDKLIRKAEETGYQTDTASALKDFEAEDKELLVNVHSEKLAISFAFVATEPGTVIRVIKNLRTCLDCHEWIKLISKIMERVIVVRDCNRFHHFKDGVCSCGNFW